MNRIHDESGGGVDSGAPDGGTASGGDRAWHRCSQCGRPFQREASRVFPFCSVRCQQIDLGRWLNEEIGLPVSENEEDATDLPPD